MRVVVLFALGISILIGLTAGLRADDEDTEREIRERCRLMNETLAIQLLEQRVKTLERWNQALFGLTESYAKALRIARQGTAAGVSILERRMTQLEEDLAAERGRNGGDDSELMQQLAAEQKRHTHDVVMLQKELMKANETAEANRIEASQSHQRVLMQESTSQRLRKQLVQSLWFHGVQGPAAKAALPWLRQLNELEDEILTEAAKAAIKKIEGDG